MAVIRDLLARLRLAFRRDALADEIREELDFHRDARVAQYERQGLSPDEARRTTRARMGSLAVQQDRGYRVRGGGFLDSVLADIRYGVRMLGSRPGFSAVAILTLALGVGASTAVVSLIDAVLLRPLPFPEPEQLVEIKVEEYLPAFEFRNTREPSAEDRAIWTASSQTLAAIAIAHDGMPVAPVMDGDPPERLPLRYVSEGYFELHGKAPVIGRAFTAADTRIDTPRVAMLSERVWRRRFEADPGIIGRVVRYDDTPTTIVGVVADGFYADTAVWQPIPTPESDTSARGRGFTMLARLRDGVTPDDAAAELTAMTAGRPYPADVDSKPVVIVRRLLDLTPERTRQTATILAAAVVVLVLIGCVNIAGLLLGRGAAREEEIAIRAAIGASRVRLIRQLLTESVVLASVGGTAGVMLAGISLDALVANVPMTLPENVAPTINLHVLGYTALITLGTGVLFGLWPAARLSRVRGGTLAPGTTRTATPQFRRSGQLLIVAEVAMATVLLAGGALMIRSLDRITSVDIGFDPSRFLTMEVAPVSSDPAVQATFYPALVERLAALPGVEAVGAIDQVPMDSAITMWVWTPDTDGTGLGLRQILPGFIDAMKLRVVHGRPLTDRDRSGEAVTGVLLSESGARALWGDQPALGRTVLLGRTRMPAEVVGIVADLRHMGPLRRIGDEIYLPFAPAAPGLPHLGLTLVIRPAERSPVTAQALREAAQTMGTPAAIERIRRGSDWYGEAIATPRQRTVLLSLLGTLGLVLALVGIFGTTAYAVARRTREIGVRMAFGARPADVVRRIVADAAWPVAIGTIAGLGAAALTTRVIESFLFETTPTEPGVLGAVAIVLVTSGLISAWVPARRAARVDPVSALRAD